MWTPRNFQTYVCTDRLLTSDTKDLFLTRSVICWQTDAGFSCCNVYHVTATQKIGVVVVVNMTSFTEKKKRKQHQRFLITLMTAHDHRVAMVTQANNKHGLLSAFSLQEEDTNDINNIFGEQRSFSPPSVPPSLPPSPQFSPSLTRHTNCCAHTGIHIHTLSSWPPEGLESYGSLLVCVQVLCLAPGRAVR